MTGLARYAEWLQPFEVVYSRERAVQLLAGLNKKDYYALDFETTALSPTEGIVRLTTIWGDDAQFILDHAMCGTFESLVDYIVGPTYIVFNAGFELQWFDACSTNPVIIWDVRLMRVAKMGGNSFSLQRMVKADLDIMLDKEEQLSDWSKPALTDKQLTYAAFDGYVTWHLFLKWFDELEDRHWKGFHVLNDVWRSNIEMEQQGGLTLDVKYHVKNIELWERKRGTAYRYFRKFTPESLIKNVASNRQVSNFLKSELDKKTIADWPQTEKTGDLKLDRNILRQAAFRMPYPMNRWMASFILVRYFDKYLSTYGETLINVQKMRGNIRGRLNVAAAVTGRYSSSGPNLQNIPRKAAIRRAFRSPYVGDRTMVLADYKGIEVRVLAQISKDKQLLHDAIYGDVHSSGAAMINHIREEDFKAAIEDKKSRFYLPYKEMRSRAKVFTFRLTYGAGVSALALSLKASDEDAQKAMNAWAERYSNAFNYRLKMAEHMNHDGFLPIADGRTVYVPKAERIIPVAANYPVQGAAASVMYRGIYRTRQQFIERGLDAVLAVTVHDELLSTVSINDAEAAHEAQIEGMTQGWLDIFPKSDVHNMLESAIGDRWSDKP